MAHLIKGNTVAETWLAAAKFLFGCPNGEAVNLFLEVKNPSVRNSSDVQLMRMVDTFLSVNDKQALETVAGTIFPADFYRAEGREGVFESYPTAMDELQQGRSEMRKGWGNYSLRLLRQRTHAGGTFNQLEAALGKLKNDNKRSCFEMNPGRVFESWEAPSNVAEASIYDPEADGNLHMNLPCLSHISFTRENSDRSLHLNATYRSHYYLERALGNLIGLGWLLIFMAHESDHKVGSLAINATFAKIEWSGFGGKKKVEALLDGCESNYLPKEQSENQLEEA